MKYTYATKTALEIITDVISGKINPDPIGQRPPVSTGTSKSEGIVKSLLDGYGIGTLIFRDIRSDEGMQKIYPGVEYLVIDGGHRTRALTEFFKNRFSVDGKFFRTSDIDFDQFTINIQVVDCSCKEAATLFRYVNTVTPVNFIEMIMADEVSEVCKLVRSRTKAYAEYNNTPLPIFDSSMKNGGKTQSHHWDSSPNPRRKWDEYVFLAMIKARAGGNADAGIPQITALVDNNSYPKTYLDVVDRFFADAVEVRKTRGKKYNADIYAAFQLVWFGFYEKNSAFKISDFSEFTSKFMMAYSKLTGHADKQFENTQITFQKETYLLKEFVRKNIKNFANAAAQRECFDRIYSLMGDAGVTFRDEKRSVNSAKREELLALQGYTCAIDNLPLTLEDSVLGHDTPWAKGGSTIDGKVIRKSHNRDMGSVTLDEYRMILQLRGELAE